MANPIFHSQYTAQQIEDSIGKTPTVNYTTRTWLIWDIETSQYVDSGVSVDTDIMIDDTLSIPDAAADAAVVGGRLDLCVRSGSTTLIINNTQAQSLLSGDANSPAINTIYGIGQTGLSIANLPGGTSYKAGNLLTLGIRTGNLNGKTQIYAAYLTGEIFVRAYVLNAWTDWAKLAGDADVVELQSDVSAIETALPDKTSLVTKTMVTSAETAQTMFGADFDNLEPNKIYCIGTPLTISHAPTAPFSGNVICFSFRETSSLSGRMQIAMTDDNRLFTRLHFGGAWTAWKEFAPTSDVVKSETVYHVGPNREYTSLIALLQDIQTNTAPAVIYMDEGEYDIYQEYRDNNVPSPPADVQAANYFDYNVFLPQNCRLVGIGNVVLKWSPASTDITVAESTTWSPLNLWYGGNTVENITIRCRNGRYCIHDDSHNAYTGFTNRYKNVRCIYTASDAGYGYNNVIGMGFEDKCTFEFEDCLLQYVGNGNHGVFYGHDGRYGGAAIIVRNCILLGGSDANNATIRLQSLRADDSNRILTLFAGCYVQGGIRLNQYNSSAGQFFDVTLLRSGNPSQTIDDAGNPYPIKVYQ